MKILKSTIAVLLALTMLFGTVSLAAAEPTAAPAQTMIPEKIAGTVTGTVLHVEENDIVINMDNGNTVMFMLNYLHVTDAAVGDTVSIDYSGDVLDAPEAINIVVTKKAVEAQTLSGTIMSFDDKRVFVTISSGNVFGFTFDKSTVITGKATALAEGDGATVTYTGQLDSIPHASAIEITSVAKTPKKADEKLKNKTLDGYVTALSSSRITIHTNSGKNYSFQITAATQITGSYSLEVGSKVRVTYDGYASKTPAAKIIKVLSPVDPTPPKPVYHTTSGFVDSFLGIFLTLTNGNTFNCTYASYGGDSDGEEGDSAKITYYIGDDGVYYATKVIFRTVYLDPAPEPEPDPDPDPYIDGAAES